MIKFFENLEVKERSKTVLISLAIYTSLLFYYLIRYNLPFDKYIGTFLIATLLLFFIPFKRAIHPVLIILYISIIYSAMHNISGKGVVFYRYVINIETFIFGGVLPNIVQRNFGTSGTTLLDRFCILIYLSHFIFPIIIGIFFWLKDRKYFSLFFTDLIILSLIGFSIYLILPTAPPWLASVKGFAPTVHKYIMKAADLFPNMNLKEIYFDNIGNMYGAMPSIHSAYPTLIYLYLGKYKKINYIIFAPVLLFIYFTLIYLGEHYGSDLIAGISLTLLIFFIRKNK